MPEAGEDDHCVGHGGVTVEDHLDEVLARCAARPPIDVDIDDAVGLVLAANVHARTAAPAFRVAAMDGFAVRITMSSATGRRRRVTGRLVAGSQERPQLTASEAVRIMTGARVPDDADAVVPWEQVHEDGDEITLPERIAADANIREPGEDLRPGDRLLPTGRWVTPLDAGLLAAAGVARVPVHPRPHVVVLSTGDELVPSGADPRPAQIHDANGPMLLALARAEGARATRLPIVADETDRLANAIAQAAADADLVLCSGGASGGDRDLLKSVLGRHGPVRAVHVAMRPGSPQLLGTVGGVPVLGLPGNPAAAAVSFLVFARPAIRQLAGGNPRELGTQTARTTRELRGRTGRRSYVRVRLERSTAGTIAVPHHLQGSHVLSSFITCDALAVVPECGVPAGEEVEVLLLPGLTPGP